MSDTQLQIGAQTRAAQIVASGVPDVLDVVENLGATLQGSMSGFRGGAAAGLAEAVTAWFEVANEIAPTLAGYAERLVATDIAAATTDAEQDQRYARLASRLGGAG